MKRRSSMAGPLAGFVPEHFLLSVDNGVATVTLNRPERKDPLTFESYAELRDTFHALRFENEVHAVVLTGAGGNVSSGGDVFEIIEPLTLMGAADLHARRDRPHGSAPWRRRRSRGLHPRDAVPGHPRASPGTCAASRPIALRSPRWARPTGM